jgi:hypothetical protein
MTTDECVRSGDPDECELLVLSVLILDTLSVFVDVSEDGLIDSLAEVYTPSVVWSKVSTSKVTNPVAPSPWSHHTCTAPSRNAWVTHAA